MPPTYNYLDLMQPLSSITSYVPTTIEPVVHPRAEEAARRGMTVEQLLELEKKNALGSGVVFEDTGSDALNYYKAAASNNPEINYREWARIAEGELKAKEEAVKAAEAIVGLAMPSTYVNTALDWSGKEKMPDWASTMVDLALPIAGGAIKKGLVTLNPILKNYRAAKNFSKYLDDALKFLSKYESAYANQWLSKFLRSNVPTIEPNSILHTLNFSMPTAVILDGKLIPSEKVNPYMGKDRIWWTTENLYNSQPDVVVLLPQNQPNITSNIIGGFSRNPSWRLTIGATDLTGAKISVVDPTTGIYRHTYLKPGTLTESKGSVSRMIEPAEKLSTGRTSLVFFEKPSKLSPLESAGLSRHNRNNITLLPANRFNKNQIKVQDVNGNLMDINAGESIGEREIYYVDGRPFKNGTKNEFILTENPFNDRPNVLRLERTQYLPIEESILFGDTPDGLKDFSGVLTNYAKSLPDVTANSTFIDNDYVNYFVNYYRNLGYDISKVNPTDLLKIVLENYTLLTNTSSGLLSNRVFWNGSPNKYKWTGNGEVQLIKLGFPETFARLPNLDKSAITAANDNVGVYFGTLPFVGYSAPRVNGKVFPFSKEITGLDMLPYVFNGIDRVYERLPEGLRGIIPQNSIVYPKHWKGNHAFGYKQYFNDEIAVGFGSLTKSLFPHPNAFVLNSDGSVTLNRQWENPKLHFKQGGKINHLNLNGYKKYK